MVTVVTESNHGGGLHGRFTMVLKQAFLEAVQRELIEKGKPELAQDLQYNDLFDLSGGTSFGALSQVALSSVNGRVAFGSPAEFGDYIDQEASEIFPHHDNFLSKLFRNPRQLLGGVEGVTRFSPKPLQERLIDILGAETRMSDVSNNIMMTMTQMHPVINARFAKSHVARGETTQLQGLDDAQRHDWLLWQATLGSASPTSYLPGVRLDNPYRDDKVVVIDGGQSGFNNPTLPVLAEIAFMCGQRTDNKHEAFLADSLSEDHMMLKMPHQIIHLDWGTGEYPSELSERAALRNTVVSVGGNLASAPMRSVSRFSLIEGQRNVEEFFSFNMRAQDFPSDIRPDSDFVLSSEDQMIRLKAAGEFAVDRLSDDIQEAARVVARAYIEKKEFEAEHDGEDYMSRWDAPSA